MIQISTSCLVGTKKKMAENNYVVIESSHKWAYHATRIMTETELMNMVKELRPEVCKLVEDALEGEDENAEKDIEWILEDFVEEESDSVYRGCGCGIISIIRLSDRYIWGDQDCGARTPRVFCDAFIKKCPSPIPK